MFTKRALRTARLIVHIFETSKPEGSPSTIAILDDGAGISYGINQATHRSGSLFQVVDAYVTDHPDALNAETLRSYLPQLEDKSPGSVARLSKDEKLKNALKQAGATPEMRSVQEDVFNRLYMQPAIKAATGSNFTLPLSLAVIYDSMNHGSFAKIRDRVKVGRAASDTDVDFEKKWILSYVTERDRWLNSVSRLKKTAYRTEFFLAQIRRGNWQLDPPMNVHGFNLTANSIDVDEPESAPTPVVQTSAPAPPPVETVNPTPAPVELKPQGASLTTKIAAAAAPAMTAATALGIKVGNVELTQATVIGICAVVLISIVVGAYLYNEGQKRAQERLKLSMENLANKDRHNVVAGGLS